MNTDKGIFKRTELLLGTHLMDRMNQTRVILFGVGGVGSWCAESLIRSGIGHLTIVDADNICATNVNRQLMATIPTIGKIKVDVLKQRLFDINPEAKIQALPMIYSEETSASFELNTYDYIIDAIDSLKHKIHLIEAATATNAVFFSSMGAALKIDPMRIKVGEFWKVQGCPLAAALRRRMRKENRPSKKFLCVYSDELLENKGQLYEKDESCDSMLSKDDMMSKKAQINGTLVHISAIFGFNLASLVVLDISKK